MAQEEIRERESVCNSASIYDTDSDHRSPFTLFSFGTNIMDKLLQEGTRAAAGRAGSFESEKYSRPSEIPKFDARVSRSVIRKLASVRPC